MLATAWPAAFTDEHWAFEPKWDGVRAIVSIGSGGVAVHGRRGVDITSRYPELGALAEAVPLVLDGEIVTMVDGVPSFERLQRRMHLTSPSAVAAAVGDVPVTFVAFDLLAHRAPVIDLPFGQRRALLADLHLGPAGQVGPSVEREGDALWQAVVERGLEGIVAKRLAGRYRPGVRSPDWRKVSNVRITEAVVGGFTTGEGGRGTTFGALLLGQWDGGRLRYVGSVGTGFSDADAKAIRSALDEMHAETSPFIGADELPRGATWVTPSLVASIGYRDVTTAGRLRHPRFRGFTGDDPREVVWAPSS